METPADCPIHEVQRRIGGKWHLVVLWHLRGGKRGFAELERSIGDVSAKALTEALRHLQKEGFLGRTVHPTVPPRVDNALTPLGTTLVPILEARQDWSLRHRTRPATEV
jgi:DNA-binding HxlR family transcriptional regulator